MRRAPWLLSRDRRSRSAGANRPRRGRAGCAVRWGSVVYAALFRRTSGRSCSRSTKSTLELDLLPRSPRTFAGGPAQRALRGQFGLGSIRGARLAGGSAR